MELIADLIIAKTPGAALNKDVFTAYQQDINGLCRFVMDAPGGAPMFTMGTGIALEEQVIEVVVQGDPTDYVQSRTEAMRLRYLIANQGEFTSRGLRMLYAMPGNINSQGRDKRNQEIMSTMFTVTLDPSYQ
jgi:hypothetical protein